MNKVYVISYVLSEFNKVYVISYVLCVISVSVDSESVVLIRSLKIKTTNKAVKWCNFYIKDIKWFYSDLHMYSIVIISKAFIHELLDSCLLQEEKKVMFYFPEETDIDSKVKNIGLSEAIVQFSS